MATQRKLKVKRRADGKIDKRTKKGKEIAERMAKARAARTSVKKEKPKKRFLFW